MTINPNTLDDECISCAEDPDIDNYNDYKCPKSKRPCGHHCNHLWSHEECCWCGLVFAQIEESPEIEYGRKIDH